MDNSLPQEYKSLTKQQKNILQAIVNGKSKENILKIFNIKNGTFVVHKRNIYTKLNLTKSRNDRTWLLHVFYRTTLFTKPQYTPIHRKKEQNADLFLKRIGGQDTDVDYTVLSTSIPSYGHKKNVVIWPKARWDIWNMSWLSQAEMWVAYMISRGYTLEDIAHQISRSKDTILRQLKSIYRKLEINKDLDLYHLAHLYFLDSEITEDEILEKLYRIKQ